MTESLTWLKKHYDFVPKSCFFISFFYFIHYKLELKVRANLPFHNSLQRVIGFSEQLLTIGEWCLHSVTLVSCFSLARWEVMNPLRAWPAYVPYTFALHLQWEFSTTSQAHHCSSFSVTITLEWSGLFPLNFAAQPPVNVVAFMWIIFFIYYLTETYS